MKTHLLQLDGYDDITSVRDKMSWGKTARILLIWPETGEIILDRRVDVLLLRRRAEELGAQLAFVTRDPEVKYHARALNIPVYRNVREAQSKNWRFRRQKTQLDLIRRIRALKGPKITSRPTPPASPLTPHTAPLTHHVSRLFVFLLALLSVTALASLLLPNATITLTPATKTQTTTFTARTSPTLTTLNASGAIPTRPITVIVEGRTTVNTTGSLTLPAQPATGRVTFTNLTDVTVIIPAGTVLLTPTGFRFTTDRQAQVPAQAGGTVDVPLTAVQPGTKGNLPENTLQTIEGTLGLQLTVTNPNPTSGGTDQTVAAPTALDRRRAYRILLDTLRTSAHTEILAQLAPGDLLLNDTPALLNILEETYAPAETVPADTLEAILRLEFQSLALTQADLFALAQTVLDTSLETGYEPIPGTLTFQLITTPELDKDQQATWEMIAKRDLTATLPGRDAVELALGRPPASARTLLTATLPLSTPPDIHLTPTWWPWMPFLPFQIQVLTIQ